MKTLGSVGTEAIFAGFLRANDKRGTIVVSPRNEVVAARLAERFPNAVTVAPDNQSVLDASDVVVLAVHRQVFEDIVPALSFRPDHLGVSLVATVPISRLKPWDLLATRVLRAIPSPRRPWATPRPPACLSIRSPGNSSTGSGR